LLDAATDADFAKSSQFDMEFRVISANSGNTCKLHCQRMLRLEALRCKMTGAFSKISRGGVVGNYYAALKILIGGETVDPYNGQIHFSEPICPDSVNSSAIVQT
jgi:hypothetical protein